MLMKKFKSVFVLAVLFILIGVNLTSAMPAGDSKINPISEEGDLENPNAPEEPEEAPITALNNPLNPKPLGPSVEVDALGPYGTPTAPYYEGDIVTFNANIINADQDDYYFRWDINNDGIWETDFPGSIKGNSSYTHEFTDDHIGLAKAEAWDGVSYKTVNSTGKPLRESPIEGNLTAPYSYTTFGWKFSLNQDVTINQMGLYASSQPINIYNIRLWDSAPQSLLRSVNNPYVLKNQWNWFNIAPIILPADDYIISAYFEGTLFPSINNPGLTPDGIVEPKYTVYSSANGFPSNQQSGPLPMIDFNYTTSYQARDTVWDYADVYVENVAPNVYAGQELVGFAGEPVVFNGSFTDPGKDDTHDILWDFGDGNTSSGNLTPSHIYDLPGTYNATLTVTDDGGMGSDNLTVIITHNKTVKDHIDDLKKIVENKSLPKGLENSLLSKLKNAQKCYDKGRLNAAINILNAFIHNVEAQRGKKIPEAEADELIDYVQLIIDMIKDEM
jgi:hypothetical protein